MDFWEWIGKFVIVGVSGGVAIFFLQWLKESRDRKARKISYHAKAVLEQADVVCGAARAMNRLFNENRLPISNYAQASLLWRETTPSILNVWEANAWVLEESEDTKPFRQRFREATEGLRQAAIAWDKAHPDRHFPARIGCQPEFVHVSDADSAENLALRQKVIQDWKSAFDHFLGEFQCLHNVLQPVVREYTSPIDRAANQ